MGARGELFTTQIYLDNRSYFFNVKENRTGDVFLQIVESKNRDGAEADRHQIAVFSEDMQKFLQGMENSLKFIEKELRDREKVRAEKKAAKEAKFGRESNGEEKTKRVYRRKGESRLVAERTARKTGAKRVHVVSKKSKEDD